MNLPISTPEAISALPPEERFTLAQKVQSLKGVILPVLVIFLVLGVIYLGVATATEAAAIGLVGSLLCAAIRRQLNLATLKKMFTMGIGVNAMVCWIMIGAVAYSRLITTSGVGEWFCALITGLELNRWTILFGMQVIFFILGCVLDPAGIILITIPIFIPIVRALGFDPLWFGVLFVMNMEMAYLQLKSHQLPMRVESLAEFLPGQFMASPIAGDIGALDTASRTRLFNHIKEALRTSMEDEKVTVPFEAHVAIVRT